MKDDPIMSDPRELLPDIRRMLGDEKAGVRSAAAQVLGFLGDKESLPQIKELLQDESEFVRYVIGRVLSELEADQ